MIKHILSDGTVLTDITGHLVKKEDTPSVYHLIDQMNKERKGNEEKDKANSCGDI